MGEEEVKRILATLEPFAPKGDMKDIYVRDIFTKEFGWHFPTYDSLVKIRDYVSGKSVLSIGSGCAFVEFLLQILGVNVTPTDPYLSHCTDEVTRHTEVEVMTAREAIKSHPGIDIFLFCWPSWNPDPDWTGEAMEMIVSGKNENTRVIHIGEGEGGCTGSQKFFDLLNEHFTMEDEVWGKNFYSIHDYVQFWGPKEADSEDEGVADN